MGYRGGPCVITRVLIRGGRRVGINSRRCDHKKQEVRGLQGRSHEPRKAGGFQKLGKAKHQISPEACTLIVDF